MKPEQAVLIFMIGATVGALTVYWFSTEEKRLVDRIRREVQYLGIHFDLPQNLFQQTIYPGAFADIQVMAAHRWAAKICKSPPNRRMNVDQLAALALICEKLMGLSPFDAYAAYVDASDDWEKLSHMKRRMKVQE